MVKYVYFDMYKEHTFFYIFHTFLYIFHTFLSSSSQKDAYVTIKMTLFRGGLFINTIHIYELRKKQLNYIV